MKIFLFLAFILFGDLAHGQNMDTDNVNPTNYLSDLKKEMQIEWPKNRTINIVFHGHSVPAGYFKTPEVKTLAAYPALVLKKIKVLYPLAVINVIVTGIGGEDSGQGAKRFNNDVLTHKPDVLFIDYGLNDRRLALEKSYEAWNVMIQKAKSQGIKVILLTPSPDQRIDYNNPNNKLIKQCDQIIRLAKENQVGLVDSYKAFEFSYTNKNKLKKYMSQVNHPNEKGHELIANKIMEWFTDAGIGAERKMVVEQDIPAGLSKARESATIAGYSLSKVQRWLHEVALPKIDPETHLYISHTAGSARYQSLWNYDDAAADTYPFLFWAAWYTDYKQVNGPILDVLQAEQRICNYLDRIPTAVNHRTLEKEIKSREDLIFAASEYVKDGLIAIVEVAGKDNPWFDRMREIEDDIWKNADISTPFGKIPTKNIEANGEQIQALVRLFTATKETKYLDWAERLADYYLSQENFVPERLRDHGCEIIGGLGLLLAVESEHRPEKAQYYLPKIKRILDEILEKGINEDGLMYNFLGNSESGLSDGWGYNYVTFLCYDKVADKPVYRAHLQQTLANLLKPMYKNYPWETGATGAINQSIDGYADALEGAIYLLNRLAVPEGISWVNREMARNVTQTGAHLGTTNLWGTYKLESNGVRTVLMHALMHTRGIIARPWKTGLELGASETDEGLLLFLKSESDWSGKLVFDTPRHRLQMGFKYDWPRMNTMPEWFTADPNKKYIIRNISQETGQTYSGKQLSEGLALEIKAGEEIILIIE